PKFSERERKAMNLSRFYAISQIEYCRNFIFKRNFPIRNLFKRSCELGLWLLTADKISEFFGQRIRKKLKGKVHTTLERVEHGHHILESLLQERLCQAVREVSHFPQRRSVQQQPRGLSSEEISR